MPPDGAFRLMEYSLPLCGGGEVVGESITSLSSSISPAVSSLSAYSSSSASTFGGGANNLPVVVRPRISIGKYEGKLGRLSTYIASCI